MSVAYRAVQWNPHKKIYDLILVLGVVLYVATFVGGGMIGSGGLAHPVTLLMRATSTGAIIMLTMILCIGPLARLSPRFSPLLYNRRHFGVTMFLVALMHGGLAIVWYHGFGVINPLVSLLTTGGDYTSLARFPFQPLGAAALLILFVMAATSHDFWLKNLTPRLWKTLHMGVYGAYGLIILHVALGFLQDDVAFVYFGLTFAGVLLVGGLHIGAGLTQAKRDAHAAPAAPENPWVDVAHVSDLPEDAATVVRTPCGRRIALVRHQNRLTAMSNVCAHQGGPLGEGRVVDGCLTCPWHGYQYQPENGQSPPPYTEKIPTYQVRIEGERIWVHPEPHPPGTELPPARLEDDA